MYFNWYVLITALRFKQVMFIMQQQHTRFFNKGHAPGTKVSAIERVAHNYTLIIVLIRIHIDVLSDIVHSVSMVEPGHQSATISQTDLYIGYWLVRIERNSRRRYRGSGCG